MRPAIRLRLNYKKKALFKEYATYLGLACLEHSSSSKEILQEADRILWSQFKLLRKLDLKT